MTVLPLLVTYATSRPARSTAVADAFVSSTYSSDADAPPVTTSATRSPLEGGHATAACAVTPSRPHGAGSRGGRRSEHQDQDQRGHRRDPCTRHRGPPGGNRRRMTGGGILGAATYPRLTDPATYPIGGEPGRMHRPHPPVPRPAPVYLEAPSLARAKRTDRTEARRRHRAEQAATIDPVEDDEATASGGTLVKGAKPAAPAAAAGATTELRVGVQERLPPGGPQGRPAVAADDPDPLGPARRPRGHAGLDRRVHPDDQRVRLVARPHAVRSRRRQADRHDLEHLVHRRQPVRCAAAGRGRVPGRVHRAARELAGRPDLRHGRRRLLQRDPAQPHGSPVHRREPARSRTSPTPGSSPRSARCSSPRRRPGTSGSSTWPTRTAASRSRSLRRRAVATRARTRA